MALCGRNKYILEFTTSGDYFPMRYDDSFDINGSSTDNIGVIAGIKFRSRTTQRVTYDLNDGGEPIVVENIGGQILGVVHYKPETDLSNNVQGRFYQDGNSGDRIIRITFEQPLEITALYVGYTRIKGELPKNIGNIAELTSIDLRYLVYEKFSKIPSEVLRLSNITSFIANNAFNTSASFYRVYPIELLNSKLANFYSVGTKQGEYANSNNTLAINNNWDKIHLLKDTVKSILVPSNNIGDGDIRSSIIDSWVQCTNLISLTIDSNKTSVLYPQLNRLTQLKAINVGGGSNIDFIMNDWGDLSDLVNLETFDGGTAYNVPTNLPRYFLNMPRLNKIIFTRCYTTQERWDIAIADLYDLVVNNAPIVNDDVTNPVSMRDQIIRMEAVAIGDWDEYIIQGTYQQPTGYVQGVSNGTPTSQLEKIWVLEHQYNVSVSYTDNR